MSSRRCAADRTQSAELTFQNQATLQSLLPYRGEGDGSSKVVPLSEEEMKAIDGEFARWRKQWVDRRKVYKE